MYGDDKEMKSLAWVALGAVAMACVSIGYALGWWLA